MRKRKSVNRRSQRCACTLLLLLVTGATAPTASAADGDLEWVRQLGGDNNDRGHAVFVDEDGNVYTTGYFAGTADFDPGAGIANLTSDGINDVFVSKLDEDGDFVWARRVGSTGVDVGTGIAVDSDGNVVVTGYFQGTVDFNPGAATSELVAVSEEAFVLRLDAAGLFVWAHQLSSSSSSSGTAIAIDSADNIVVTGSFAGTTDFDPGAGDNFRTSAGSVDAFVWKLLPDGSPFGAWGLGGGFSDAGTGVETDSSNNIYVTGFFSLSVDFDPELGTTTLSASGDRDGFVWKLSSSMTFTWARQVGGAGVGGDGVDHSAAVAVDPLGNVYTTGGFFGTADFDPGAGTSNLTSAGDEDVFVWKLDPSGNLVWARRQGGTGADHAAGIAVDAVGSVYNTGNFEGTADFDPGAGVASRTSAAFADVFVSKLNDVGGLLFADQVGGSGDDKGFGIAADTSGSAQVTGFFNTTVDFDPGAGVANLTVVIGEDAFVWKLTEPSYVSVVPGRLMDTRVPASATVDGLYEGVGSRAAGSTTELQVTGRAGVPADAEAVVLNVTVTGAAGGGFVTVYPCGAIQPNASNLNFATGDTIPNLVITQIGTAGRVCVFTSATTNLIADLNGYYPAGSAYTPLVPERLLDSRIPASPTVDGLFQAIGLRSAGSTTELQVTGRAAVPLDAAAVVLNVTVTGPQSGGFVTVYPCGAAPPNASNLNFATGDNIPNLVITKIGAAGKVCLFTSAGTHLIADINGYYPADSTYTSLAPGRLLDSRVPASATVDGAFEAIGVRAAGTTTELQVTGRHGVPAAAETAVLNITVTGPTGDGFITVYPCGAAPPNASNLNFVAGDNIPNLVITQIGTGGKVCLFTSANTHLIADINGYYES